MGIMRMCGCRCRTYKMRILTRTLTLANLEAICRNNPPGGGAPGGYMQTITRTLLTLNLTLLQPSYNICKCVLPHFTRSTSASTHRILPDAMNCRIRKSLLLILWIKMNIKSVSRDICRWLQNIAVLEIRYHWKFHWPTGTDPPTGRTTGQPGRWCVR